MQLNVKRPRYTDRRKADDSVPVMLVASEEDSIAFRYRVR